MKYRTVETIIYNDPDVLNGELDFKEVAKKAGYTETYMKFIFQEKRTPLKEVYERIKKAEEELRQEKALNN